MGLIEDIQNTYLGTESTLVGPGVATTNGRDIEIELNQSLHDAELVRRVDRNVLDHRPVNSPLACSRRTWPSQSYPTG